MSSTSSARKKNMGNSSSQTQAKKKTSTLTNSKLTDTYQNTAPSPSPSAPAKSFSSTPGSVATTPGTVLNGFLSGRGRGLTRTSNIERDLVVFPNDLKRDDNLKFYRNEIKSKPFPGTKFKDMMRWKGDYHKLEYEHQYIQWLFPLPEGKGLNYSAQPLQEHEAIAIQSDNQIRLNVLRAYTMMLDFYGMELVSSDTGEVKRSKNYIERFEHLNRSMHNYRRITRIIKSLGCLGFGHLQAPWVRFIIKEALVEKTLPRLNGRSMYHWIDAIADTKEREDTLNYFLKLSEGSDVDFIDNDTDENMDFDVGSGHVAGNGSSADRVHGVDSGRQNYSVQAGDYERSVNGRGVDNEHGKVRNDNSGHSSERGHFEGTSDTANNLARNLAAASSVGTSDNIDKSDPTCKVVLSAMIFLLQVFSMVAERFTKRQEPEKETTPESELGESEHNRPAPEQSSPQYQPRGPDHEEAGITRIAKKKPIVSKSAVDERTRFSPLFSQPYRGVHSGVHRQR